jgi:hypothetical protein
MVVTRKALLVAIDDYGDPRNNLTSCINDSRAFEDLLKTYYGFAPEVIHVLRNQQATPACVDAELAWLCKDARADDRLVFHYSGHGYRVPSDKPGEDGIIEEVLVLSGPSFYRDDRLSQHTCNLPPGILTVICDSCFSGGMEKAFHVTEDSNLWAKTKCYQPIRTELLQDEQSISPTRMYKSFGGVAVEDAGFAALSANGTGKVLVEPLASDETDDLQIQGILLSACLETETASAQTQHTKGLSAFTFAIAEALHEFGPGVAIRDLLENSGERLRRLGFKQTPLLKERLVSDGVGTRSFILLEPTARSSITVPTSGTLARSGDRPMAGELGV